VYVHSRETKDAAYIAGVLTEDEARRIASNIAKLPDLLRLKTMRLFYPFSSSGHSFSCIPSTSINCLQ
jgi:hypothetical protein